MATKGAVRRTIDELAEDFGLETTGGLFRAKRAAGTSEGVEVSLRIGSSAEAIGYSDDPTLVSAWSEHHSGGARRGVVRGQKRYQVVAATRHSTAGVGLRIVATSTPIDKRGGSRLITTGDSVFDDGLLVLADDGAAARRFLSETMRSTIVAFFEAGAMAVITDDEIAVLADGSARVLAPQIRNAVRMSRAMSERAAEL